MRLRVAVGSGVRLGVTVTSDRLIPFWGSLINWNKPARIMPMRIPAKTWVHFMFLMKTSPNQAEN